MTNCIMLRRADVRMFVAPAGAWPRHNQPGGGLKGADLSPEMGESAWGSPFRVKP